MNTATAITIGAIATLTPTVTCIIAYLFSRQNVRDLRAEFRARLDAQDAKLDAFSGKIDALSARIDAFSPMLASLKDASHKDSLEIMRTMIALHERVAVVEAKQASQVRSLLRLVSPPRVLPGLYARSL